LAPPNFILEKCKSETEDELYLFLSALATAWGFTILCY